MSSSPSTREQKCGCTLGGADPELTRVRSPVNTRNTLDGNLALRRIHGNADSECEEDGECGECEEY